MSHMRSFPALLFALALAAFPLAGCGSATSSSDIAQQQEASSQTEGDEKSGDSTETGSDNNTPESDETETESSDTADMPSTKPTDPGDTEESMKEYVEANFPFDNGDIPALVGKDAYWAMNALGSVGAILYIHPIENPQADFERVVSAHGSGQYTISAANAGYGGRAITLTVAENN
ncbi:hypothetical protein [Bifidobacterium sp. SO4]|uniref:hypothetical protein n=1 Tax=Bifidobacterium sp. SO4 TaxID=2809030 RepID=UPI001BDD1039|nr:hypothetical protein [Bifidobacterium sp. SO4]MBT1170977.1 hypothetical protein [Bifidobacterium sp. SO4]